MTKYVALYCRLSPRPDGTYEGVDDQEKWGRRYSAGHWPDLPVKVFADKGISAANGDHRPRFEALRQALAAGEVAQVWTVEQTRLERTEVGWFRLAAEMDAASITELHTDRDGIVRVRDEVAGIKAVLAAGEVRKLKRRVNDRLAEIAADGRPAGSRPFGYVHGVDEQGGKTYLIVPEQAAVIRESADRILTGWSLARIAADLVARGVVGGHGGKVTAQTVRSMVTNPTVAGWRTHQGRRIRGRWQPILDQDTWDEVRDRLAAPRTVQQANGFTYPVPSGPYPSTARRYLLTGGIAVCGVCQAPLIASMKQLRGGKVKPYYLCNPKTGGRGCIGIMADEFEAYVAKRLLAELDKPAFRQALAQDEYAAERDRITAGIRASEARRRTLAARWGAGDLDDDEYHVARDGQKATEARLRAELAEVPPAAARIDVDLVREAWPSMNLDERREIVGMFITKVIVKRATPGLQKFDENRVGVDGIVWRV